LHHKFSIQMDSKDLVLISGVQVLYYMQCFMEAFLLNLVK